MDCIALARCTHLRPRNPHAARTTRKWIALRLRVAHTHRHTTPQQERRENGLHCACELHTHTTWCRLAHGDLVRARPAARTRHSARRGAAAGHTRTTALVRVARVLVEVLLRRLRRVHIAPFAWRDAKIPDALPAPPRRPALVA